MSIPDTGIGTDTGVDYSTRTRKICANMTILLDLCSETRDNHPCSTRGMGKLRPGAICSPLKLFNLAGGT